MISDPNDWMKKLAQEARILGEARMLRDDAPYTEEIGKLILARFRDHLARAEKSDAWAARSLAIGESTLSQILSGNYPGDVEKMVRKIDKWTERQIERELAPKPAGFVTTEIFNVILGAAKWAMKTNSISVVTGPAGVGKTMSLEAIRGEFPGTVMISIRAAGQSKLSVLSALARADRLPNIKMTSDQLQQQLEERFAGTNRLILVDEIDKLADRRKDEALFALKDLHDHTECPMVWGGMSNIKEHIQTGKSKWQSLDQIDSRIGQWIDLTARALGTDGGGGKLYTIRDIRDWIAQQGMRVSPDAEGFIMKLANRYGAGGLRTIKQLARRAIVVAKGQIITAEMLADIRWQQTGRQESFEVEIAEQRIARAG